MSDAPLHRESESARPHLPWFGIPALIPFLKPFRRPMTLMVTLCLAGGCLDICLPLFQRYAIDHFIAGETLDTLPAFIQESISQSSSSFNDLQSLRAFAEELKQKKHR